MYCKPLRPVELNFVRSVRLPVSNFPDAQRSQKSCINGQVHGFPAIAKAE